MQDLVGPSDAVPDRARELVGEEQQVDDALDADLAAVDAAVAGMGAAGAQDGAPLQGFQRRIAVRRLRLRTDVEEAARHVGALEEPAELEEVPAFVAGQGGVGDAVEEHRGGDDLLVVSLREAFEELEAFGRGHEEVQGVDLGPHLVGDLVTHRPRVLAGEADAREDRIRIAEVEREESGDVTLHRLRIERTESAFHRRSGQDGRPVFLGGATPQGFVIEQHLLGDAHETGEVLGPLHLAGHPVLVVGDSGKHHGREVRPRGPRCLCCRRPATSSPRGSRA